MSSATDVSEHRSRMEGGRRVQSRRRWLRLALMLVLPLILILAGTGWYLASGRYVSTDDAYVQADTVTVSSDVAGRVVEVAVHDNERVSKGQLLFKLDDRPYRIAVERATAQLAAAKLQVESLRASYQQKLADVKQAQDTLAYQQREFQRQQQLLASRVVSQATFDNARHNLDTARQQLAAAQQQLANALASLGGDPNIPTDRHPMVQQAQAQLDQARLDLSYTVVRASTDGIVTKVDKLPVGTYLNAAAPAFSLVSSDHVWIEANYKETDLTHMKVGQEATVTVDAYPGESFQAQIVSLSPGTGAEFSVLPAQNATGNWVKVVQRVPVRLAIEHPEKDRPLRAGMSANVEVDTRHVRPIVASIESLFEVGQAQAESAR